MRLSHVAWNLGGLGLPLCVAAITVPGLIATLGHERFGLLALAWGLIGYAGAMDLGVGRALTQLVSRLLGEQRTAEVPNVLKTASRITLVTGVIGGGLIASFAIGGGYRLVGANATPAHEILAAMLLLAVALPAQAMSATYRGLNEAYLNFKGISLLRATLGVVNFGGPYLVTLFTTSLPWVIAPLVASRLIALFVYRQFALKNLHVVLEISKGANYSSKIARALFAFGGWVTVSSIVSPILVQADRFVIASTVSAAAVSSYVLPYEIVAQSLILVGAVTSVIFPGLSKMIHESPGKWRLYFNKWLWRIALLMAAVCTIEILLLPLILPLWIGRHLNPISILIGQILCVGVFFNSIGAMFYALLHARGHAQVTAKLHLIELPLLLISLSLLVGKFGAIGAACAWTGRMVIDGMALMWLAKRN